MQNTNHRQDAYHIVPIGTIDTVLADILKTLRRSACKVLFHWQRINKYFNTL